MELLLEADPDESVVKAYINKGDMFVCFDNNKPVCIAIVIKIDEDVLINIANSSIESLSAFLILLLKLVVVLLSLLICLIIWLLTASLQYGEYLF